MKNDINLIYKRETKKSSPKIMAIVVIVIVVLAAGLYAGIALPSSALAAAKAQLDNLNNKLGTSSTIQKELSDKSKQVDLLSQQLIELKALGDSKSDISRYVEAIERSLPTDSNITQLSLSGQIMNINGIAKNDTVIATFLLKLREQNVFKNVYLSSSSASTDGLTSQFILTADLPSSLNSELLIKAIENKDTGTAAPLPTQEASKK